MNKRIFRLGELMSEKYKTAADPLWADVSASIRNQFDSLWSIPNEQFNILRACADTEGQAAKGNDKEALAIKGNEFCKEVLSIIDFLKAKRDTVPLKEARRALETLVALIKRYYGSAKSQFPSVIELIFQIMPSSTHYDRKIREQEYQKARKGLSRIMSLSLTILNMMNKLGGAPEMQGRFESQVGKLSESEIMQFIRRFGDQYGIPDLETWSIALDTDPRLEKPLTKLVHSLLRGHTPAGADKIKPIIQNIMKRRHERQQTNVPLLEQEESLPTFEEEESEAWDAKIASKYNDLALGNLLRKGIL